MLLQEGQYLALVPAVKALDFLMAGRAEVWSGPRDLRELGVLAQLTWEEGMRLLWAKVPPSLPWNSFHPLELWPPGSSEALTSCATLWWAPAPLHPAKTLYTCAPDPQQQPQILPTRGPTPWPMVPQTPLLWLSGGGGALWISLSHHTLGTWSGLVLRCSTLRGHVAKPEALSHADVRWLQWPWRCPVRGPPTAVARCMAGDPAAHWEQMPKASTSNRHSQLGTAHTCHLDLEGRFQACGRTPPITVPSSPIHIPDSATWEVLFLTECGGPDTFAFAKCRVPVRGAMGTPSGPGPLLLDMCLSCVHSLGGCWTCVDT